MVPARSPEETAASRVYGALRLQEREIDAEVIPHAWASWWYPRNNAYFFQSEEKGKLSPLEKYDLYVAKTRGKASHAAAFERDKLYEPKATAWEGLCHAWAAASVLHPEPARAAKLEGIDFTVADLKALLVKTYEGYHGLTPKSNGVREYGERFNGKRKDVYDDIYPDQFHLVMESELGIKGRPVIIDYDPGIVVWNAPVWRFQSKIVRDAQDPGVLHVATAIQRSSPFVDQKPEGFDYVGDNAINAFYTYDLVGDPQPDGSVEVSFGVWTGLSEDDHPDFVMALPDNPGEIVRKTFNEELDIAIVDEILRRAAEGTRVLP